MAIDTTDFDAKIAAKQAEIDAAQANVDSDTFIAEQKTAQTKTSVLATAQNAKASLESDKTVYVDLCNKIDALTVERDALIAKVKG